LGFFIFSDKYLAGEPPDETLNPREIMCSSAIPRN